MDKEEKYNNLQKELIERYIDSNFLIKFNKEDNLLEIIYNNHEYIFNDDFIDGVILICEKYLSEEELFHMAILYDYLEEVKYERNKI